MGEFNASARAKVTILIGPERQRAADDGACGDGSEVAAVEAVRDVPIHEEELAVGDDAAALPDRQSAADPATVERIAHLHAIDRDGVAGAANPLAGKTDDALQQRHAAPDIAALDHETGKRFRWPDGDQLRHFDPVDRLDGVETDRRARRGVPEEFCRHIGGAGGGDAEDGEQHHREDTAAAHGPILRRPIHAAWRSGV